MLLDAFDEDGSGAVDVNEFVDALDHAVRGRVPSRRIVVTRHLRLQDLLCVSPAAMLSS